MINCATPLVIQAYGGGTRYHCPTCDVHQPAYGIIHAYWTNGPVPDDRKCPNKKPVPKHRSIFKNMKELR